MSQNAGKVGRPSKVATAIAVFISKLKTAAPDAYEGLWRQECASVLGNYPLNTQRAYLTQYRNAVRTEFGENHPALSVKASRLLKDIPSDPDIDHNTSNSTAPISTSAAHFISKLKAATPDAYEGLWRQECASVLGSYPLDTQRVYLTKYYRNPIHSELGEDHPILALMSIKAVREIIASAATSSTKATALDTVAINDTPVKRASNSIFAVFADRLRIAEPNDIEHLWQQEWEARNLSNYPASTQHTYVTKYRKAIIETLGEEHPAVGIVKTLKTARSLKDSDYMISGRGRPPVLQQQISGFVNAIKDARHTSRGNLKKYHARVRDLWESELNRLLGNYTTATVSKNTSAYRSALVAEGLTDDDELLSIVCLPEELYAGVRKNYGKKLVARQNDLLPAYNWEKIVETAVSLLPPTPDCTLQQLPIFAKRYAVHVNEQQATKIAFALQIITGRRPFEVFCLGKISPVFSDPPTGATGKVMDNWHVEFVGQAKTKERDGTKFGVAFTIPILTKAKTVLFAWSVLRQSTFGKAWTQINDSETFAKTVLMPTNPSAIYSNIRKKILLPLWPQADKPGRETTQYAKELGAIRSGNIRSLYAEIADHFFRPKDKTKAAFFASILGHSDDDLETQSSYMKYYLPDVGSKPAVVTSKRRINSRLIENAKLNQNF